MSPKCLSIHVHLLRTPYLSALSQACRAKIAPYETELAAMDETMLQRSKKIEEMRNKSTFSTRSRSASPLSSPTLNDADEFSDGDYTQQGRDQDALTAAVTRTGAARELCIAGTTCALFGYLMSKEKRMEDASLKASFLIFLAPSLMRHSRWNRLLEGQPELPRWNKTFHIKSLRTKDCIVYIPPFFLKHVTQRCPEERGPW